MISYDKAKDSDAVMSAEEILVEIRRMAETSPEVGRHVELLNEAIAALQKFISAKEEELMGPATPAPAPVSSDGVVDTGTLTGPINGLKSFLIKKQRDKEAK